MVGRAAAVAVAVVAVRCREMGTTHVEGGSTANGDENDGSLAAATAAVAYRYENVANILILLRGEKCFCMFMSALKGLRFAMIRYVATAHPSTPSLACFPVVE